MNNGGGEYQWAINSFFGRLNYNYKERYLVEANIRTDGSSRFAEGNRYGVFPSFSAAWRISEEPFMESIRDRVDNLKLRASWGKLATRISEVPIIPLLSNSLRALYLWEVIFTRPLLLPRSPIGTLHGRLLP